METKLRYIAPQIELIQLDKEISLALSSSPPDGPDEGLNGISTPDYFNSNPNNSTFA
jgi:hypothetical protein